MPKVLFTDEYKDLSAEAKLLYGLMLDRMQLSAINGWCDKNGEVFIFYTIAETSEMLGCGHDKATRLQRGSTYRTRISANVSLFFLYPFRSLGPSIQEHIVLATIRQSTYCQLICYKFYFVHDITH